MRLRFVSAAFAALGLATISCSENDLTGPESKALTPRMETVTAAAVSLTPVRISEFHYDNTGTDAGEKIEVSFPVGTDLTGWSIVLYNGSGGATYNTDALTTGSIGTTCGTRSVVVLSYAVNGIQNGSPDGIALVRPDATVAEFLTYEGPFAATNGPAVGMVGRNIGVIQDGSGAAGLSLQMDSVGTWYAATNSFGACNDNQALIPANTVASVTVTPAATTVVVGGAPTFTGIARNSSSTTIPGATLIWSSTNLAVATVNVNGQATTLTTGSTQIIATATNGFADTAALTVVLPPSVPITRFSEIHYDNFGSDLNEGIEIEGPAGTVVTGWQVVLYNGNGGAAYDTQLLSGSIPLMCDGRGVVYITYPPDGIQNGAPDGFALVNSGGTVIEFLSYEGSFTATDGPAAGMTSYDIGVSETSVPIGQSLSRNAAGLWQAPAAATIGGCNSGVGPPPPPPVNSIAISGRTLGDVALPVGFEDQLFATLRSGTGVVLETTFTWSSETPSIASIDADGVMHALTAGSAIFRATATDGTTRIYALPMRVGIASATAIYANHTEFGVPADSDPSNDFIVNRTEYKSSFNGTRGIPNWVSYNLEATHFGSEDRCDCFTYDPLLPAAYPRYTTADYTDAGAFHGYGIDRGHLARSFDRTSGSLDNARTFYFSNIIPQAAALNQGIWAALENDLGDLARFQDKEVFIITGASGSLGTVKNEGLITIPSYVWKVAVILPRDQGLASVDDINDLETIAVVMPNSPLVTGVWQNYETTIDSVEALSGYNLLDLLPDPIEIAVESGATDAIDFIEQLVSDGDLKPGAANALVVKLQAAFNALSRGQNGAAANQLRALLNEIDALVRSGRMSAEDADALRALLAGIIGAAN